MEKISVITPCYNSAATIGDTLQSISAQTYSNIEHIIVDGGSKDNTLEIVRNMARPGSVIISEPDEGIYDAMNKGLRRATGGIVSVLNSDDYYASDLALARMMAFMADNDLQAAWGDIEYLTAGIVGRYWRAGHYTPGKFRFGWVPPHPAFFCQRSLLDQFGYLRYDMPVAADYELMFRLIEKHRVRCGYLPGLITKMRTGGNSGSVRNIFKGNFSDIARAWQINGHAFPWQFPLCKPLLKIKQYNLKAR
ncbi:MAG: glycosyltransferase [Sedimentisphaerales bacterium]|nr:glycosyltransferase [Sedimentisphaerales bacterium]